ncbi:MAG: proton-conducting transporter membrane subunit, partial [Planctomycetota bacterium]
NAPQHPHPSHRCGPQPGGLSIDFLKPIAYSACIVGNHDTVKDTVLQSYRTMEYLEQEQKLKEIRDRAQKVKTSEQLAKLTLNVLVLLSQMDNQGLVERIVRALDHGKYLEEKIKLNEDDSAAVHHVIKGTVETGEILLQCPSIADSEFTFEATYEFKDQHRERVDELRLIECSDKAALIASNSVNAAADETKVIQNRVDRFKEVVRLVVGLKAQLSLLHQVGHPHLFHLLEHKGPPTGFWSNGISAILFYLLCYGVMNAGAFAVLACFERGRSNEVDEVDDLRGMHKTHPHLAAAMLLCVLSLLGLPPLLGFFGKLGLFSAVIARGEYVLAIMLAINSAIAAFYYLRLAAAVYLDPRDEQRTADITSTPFPTRPVAALLSAGGVLILVGFVQTLVAGSDRAATYDPPADPVVISSGQ